jgi:uncharacterized protein YegL
LRKIDFKLPNFLFIIVKMTVQEIIGILDRSGSMCGKEADTVGGINAMLKEVKNNNVNSDTVRVSMKLFDHEEHIKWRRVPLEEVEDFPVAEFVPRGQTALLDALGHSLTYFMEMKLRDREAYDTCLMYVATDGLENASKYYTRKRIKELIQSAETTYGISVIYLGANQDAILEANNIGIAQGHAINYSENPDSTEAVYRAVGRVASDNREAPMSAIGFSQEERQASQQNEPPPVHRQSGMGLQRQASQC